MSKVRKAIVAAIGAGISAAVAAFPDGITLGEAGTIVGAIVVVGYGTWAVKNEDDVLYKGQ